MFRRKQPWERSNESLYIIIAGVLILGIILGFFLDSDEVVKANQEGVTKKVTKEVEKEATREIEKEVTKEVIKEVKSPIYHITADQAILVGEYGNNIQWDGTKLKTVNTTFEWKMDTKNKIGSMILEYEGVLRPEGRAILNGTIRIEFTTFEGREGYMQKGMAEDITLYGNSGHEHDYFPKTHAFLAGWGRATIFLDGYPMFTNLDAHIALTEGIRRENGTISKKDGTLYRQKVANEDGFTDPEDKEIQIILRSPETSNSNFPPYTQWVTVLIEDFNLESDSKAIE